MKTERELFEEAFKKVNSGVSFWLNTWSDEDNDYGHLTASWGWHMWQASANRQGYKIVPVDDANIMDMIYGKCPCGSSRAPIISDREGYSLIHCFSCGANKYIHEDF